MKDKGSIIFHYLYCFLSFSQRHFMGKILVIFSGRQEGQEDSHGKFFFQLINLAKRKC